MENYILSKEELEELLTVLSPKRRRFCEEYSVLNNGSAAAINAGYAVSSARITASKLLTKTNIKRYLRHLRALQTKATTALGAKVIEELSKMAFSNPLDFVEFSEGKLYIKDLEDIRGAEVIKTIKVKQDAKGFGSVAEIVLHDKIKPLELLGRHAALFTDNVDITSGGEKLPEAVNNVTVNINHRKPGEELK